LKSIKLGPLPKEKVLKMKICNFVNNDFKLTKKYLTESKDADSEGNKYYEHIFEPELTIHSDIKIKIKKDINFYVWINLWYSTWEMIKKFYDSEEEKNNGITKLKSFDINDKEVNVIHETNTNYKNYNNNINNNNKINILLSGEQKADKKDLTLNSQTTSLYEIIYKLKHNTDLNELINIINTNTNTSNKFGKNDMEIKLSSQEFDKFQEIKEYNNLEMTITYSLYEK
jgi:hypothetical protein